jgi:hypothetical protein
VGHRTRMGKILIVGRPLGRPRFTSPFGGRADVICSPLEQLFIDANYLPVSLAAKLDFAGPPIEALNADR